MQNFFVSCSSLKSSDIFLPSIKFSLTYLKQNFFNEFFKKMRVNYLFESKTIEKKECSKIIQIVF